MSANVRLHSSGRFEARIQLNNRQYSAYGSTEEEAAENLEKKVLLSQSFNKAFTFAQWMEERYLPSIQTTSAKHQQKAKWATGHLGRLANIQIQEINRHALQVTLDQKCKTLKLETLKTIKSVWSAALNLAEADDVIIKNPMRFVRLPRQLATIKEVYSAGELLRLIEYSRGYAAHPIAVLGGLMGLRIGEIVALEPKHFSVKGRLTVPGTKTAASRRDIPLPELVAKEIGHLSDWPLASAGTPARNALKRAAFRAQLEVEPHPHMLRHTYASLLEWIGCPLDVRSRLLGHGKRTITERYSHSQWNNWELWQNALAEHVYASSGEIVGYTAAGILGKTP